MAAIAGLGLLILAYIPLTLINLVEQRPGPISLFWEKFAPNTKYLGVYLLSLTLGWPLGYFLNHFVDGDQVRRSEILEHGDELEKLVTSAIDLTYEDPQLYMTTLSGGKVYIGLILSETNPYGDRDFLTLLKFASGYRTEKHRINITTKYSNLIDKVRDEEDDDLPGHVNVRDFEVIIPKGEIIQISRFEPDLRDHFPDGPKMNS